MRWRVKLFVSAGDKIHCLRIVVPNGCSVLTGKVVFLVKQYEDVNKGCSMWLKVLQSLLLSSPTRIQWDGWSSRYSDILGFAVYKSQICLLKEKTHRKKSHMKLHTINSNSFTNQLCIAVDLVVVQYLLFLQNGGHIVQSDNILR